MERTEPGRVVARKRTASRTRLESIQHALAGLKQMLVTEPNARLHLAATVLALGLAAWLKIERNEFLILVLAIVGVWMTEAFNTVLEMMADLVVGNRYSDVVKRTKDVAAAAVLIACVGALCVGAVILGPPLQERLAQFNTG